MSAGRPTKFNEAIREKLIALAEAGKTNEQMAEIIGVHVRTIENWQGKHPEFMWALKEAKQIADDLVEASLFSRAVGYSYKSVKIFSYEGDTFEHEYVEHHPPSEVACIFWLKNRQPDQWRADPKNEEPPTQPTITFTPEQMAEFIRIARGDK